MSRSVLAQAVHAGRGAATKAQITTYMHRNKCALNRLATVRGAACHVLSATVRDHDAPLAAPSAAAPAAAVVASAAARRHDSASCTLLHTQVEPIAATDAPTAEYAFLLDTCGCSTASHVELPASTSGEIGRR